VRSRLLAPAELRSLIEALADRLEAAEVRGSIYLLGGAAMALVHYEPGLERRGTRDIDALLRPEEEVVEVADELGRERGLLPGWVNSKAVMFLPHDFDLEGGIPVVEREGLCVTAAPADLMLALKLRACRPVRDMDDVAILLRLCDIRSVEEAERHLAAYFDGEEEMPPMGPDLVADALDQYELTSAEPPLILDPVDPEPARDRCDAWLAPGLRCSKAPDHRAAHVAAERP
jgi:hypothetical protein